jgi:AcrR family transcriptional regulator
MSSAPAIALVRRPAGRPRDRRLDAAVLGATRRLLVEVGYRSLSLEAVARRAGVHRPAIYRRWRTKAELVHAAVYPEGDVTLRVTDSGDLARDLRTCVRNAIGLFSRPEVMAAVPGLVADLRHDLALQRRLLPAIEASARADFAHLVAGAVARGEARPDVDAGALFDALAGTVLFRVVTAGPQGLRGLERTLTALLLDGAGATKRRRGRAPPGGEPRPT